MAVTNFVGSVVARALMVTLPAGGTVAGAVYFPATILPRVEFPPTTSFTSQKTVAFAVNVLISNTWRVAVVGLIPSLATVPGGETSAAREW